MTVTVTSTPPPNIPPKADAGSDKTVEVNHSVTITGSGTDSDGTIVSYEWKKGSTVLATTASFDYTPNTVGTDTLTLTVTDDDGATGSESMTVTVTDPSAPPPTGSFLDDFSSDTLSDYMTGGDGTFTYDGTNERALVATSGGTGFTFSQALSSADEGTFTFDVSTISYNGSEAEIELILYENANTYYKIVNRYGGSRTGGITKYINGTRMDSRWFNHKYAQGQDYTISVDFSPSSTTVNAFGETLTINSNHTAITVTSFRIRTQNQDAAYDNIEYLQSGTPPPNTPPAANAGADKSVEVNQTVTITGSGTDTDGTISAYEWSKEGIVLATTASFDYTPNTVGTDTLTLTVTDDDGATGSESMTVTVTDPSAPPPTGSFLDDFSSDTLSDYMTGGDGTFTYDGTNERALVATSGGTGFTFSQALSSADEGTFTFDVSTISYNGSEAEIELILYENANTYYKIVNRYGGSRTGGITKYINGTRMDSRWFNHKYAQGQDYTISVDFSPSSTTVNAFGETLTINSNHTAITVTSFRIRTQNQDAAYDNIEYRQ